MSAVKNLNLLSQQHPFHLVDPSPHPFMTSLAIFELVLGFLMNLHFFETGAFNLLFSLFVFCYCLFRWFSDIVLESTFEGHHTEKVQQGIKLGMLLFIVSEVMFFFSFFWAYFHFALSPSIWIGGIWPPCGIAPLINPAGLPLLNTVILLSSGVSVTYADYAIRAGLRAAATKAFVITIFYGVIFTGFQLFEYSSANFSINDSSFGSIFYMATGFHGFHVVIGSIFLVVSLLRHCNYHFTKTHHVGFECAVWYWHFVDVVWLYLFVIVYCWNVNGGSLVCCSSDPEVTITSVFIP
jgi:cytochrome c oxidase subunit 3